MFDMLSFTLFITIIVIAVIVVFVFLYFMRNKAHKYDNRMEPDISNSKQLNLFEDNYGVLNVRKVESNDNTKIVKEDVKSPPPFKETFTAIQKQSANSAMNNIKAEHKNDEVLKSSPSFSAPDQNISNLNKHVEPFNKTASFDEGNIDGTTNLHFDEGKSSKSLSEKFLSFFTSRSTKKDYLDSQISDDNAQTFVDRIKAEIHPPRPNAIKTVAFILMAPEGQPYLGQEIIEVAKELDLSLGAEGFLEHITTTYYGEEVVYSVAHLLHPGSFEVDDIKQLELPGLLFFMHVPGPDPDVESFDIMLKGAAYFGQALGGVLLNDQRQALDRSMVAYLQEEISVLEKQAWEQAAKKHNNRFR